MLYEFRSDRREHLDYMQDQFDKVIEQARAQGMEIETEVLGIRPCSGSIDPERQRTLLERACMARAATGAKALIPERNTLKNPPYPRG